MKLASFDIEISDNLSTPGEPTWPPRISCAALALSDAQDDVIYYTSSPDSEHMTPGQVTEMLRDLHVYTANGYKILTWNGVAFDFQVVAANCEDVNASKKALEIAYYNHIDMMLLVSFQVGYRLGLDAALLGAGLAGKKHEVRLSDGTLITDMSGAKAPELWRKGERSAVLEYLHDDVIQPLLLADDIDKRKSIYWTSKKGRPMAVGIPALYTVQEASTLLAEPADLSWLTDPIERTEYIQRYLPDALPF